MRKNKEIRRDLWEGNPIMGKAPYGKLFQGKQLLKKKNVAIVVYAIKYEFFLLSILLNNEDILSIDISKVQRESSVFKCIEEMSSESPEAPFTENRFVKMFIAATLGDPDLMKKYVFIETCEYYMSMLLVNKISYNKKQMDKITDFMKKRFGKQRKLSLIRELALKQKNDTVDPAKIEHTIGCEKVKKQIAIFNLRQKEDRSVFYVKHAVTKKGEAQRGCYTDGKRVLRSEQMIRNPIKKYELCVSIIHKKSYKGMADKLATHNFPGWIWH
jgi:hypothetical protein